MSLTNPATWHPAGNEGPAPALPLGGFGDSDMPRALMGAAAAGPTCGSVSLHVSEHSARMREGPGDVPLRQGLASPFSSTAPGSERCTCAGRARSPPCTPCCSAADRSGVSGPGKAAQRAGHTSHLRAAPVCRAVAPVSLGSTCWHRPRHRIRTGSSDRVHPWDSQACGRPGGGAEPVKETSVSSKGSKHRPLVVPLGPSRLGHRSPPGRGAPGGHAEAPPPSSPRLRPVT